MIKYILKRIILCVLVVAAAAVIIFSIMYFVPGDPAEIMLGSDATLEMIEAKREELGLNDPYLVRLGRFLYDTFIRFDLGTSYTYKLPVIQELLARFPRTVALGVSCVVLSTIISLPLGIWAALNNGKMADYICMIIAMIAASVPNFWFALMLVILFSVKLGLLPSFGIGGIEYYIMPVMAGSLATIGGLSRQTRSGMLDVIKSDFITTARAKGLPEKSVVLKHMLPNALIPVITVIGGQFGRCIGGTIVIEQIFSIPGIGTYMLNAINSRDYPIVQGGVILLAATTSIIMLLTDLVYAWVDPRIKAQYIGKGGR